MRVALTVILLGITWLLWSGVYQPLILGLGALSVLLALLLAGRTGFFRRGIFSLHLLPRLPRFWAWLFVEIVRSNLAVLRIVLSRRPRVSPKVVTLHTHAGPIAQMLLANAITLTPGTLTMDVHEGRLRIHCLTGDAGCSLEAGEMARRVEQVTGD